VAAAVCALAGAVCALAGAVCALAGAGDTHGVCARGTRGVRKARLGRWRRALVWGGALRALLQGMRVGVVRWVTRFRSSDHPIGWNVVSRQPRIGRGSASRDTYTYTWHVEVTRDTRR